MITYAMSVIQVLVTLIVTVAANNAESDTAETVQSQVQPNTSPSGILLLGLQLSTKLTRDVMVLPEDDDDDDDGNIALQQTLPMSANIDTPEGTSEAAPPLASGSLLGLQRSMQLIHNKVVLKEDAEEDVALQQSISATADIGTPEETTSEAMPSLARGSLLGLQRSTKLSRTEVPLQEDEDMKARPQQPLAISKNRNVESTKATPMPPGGSVLGFQRSMQLTKGYAVEDQDNDVVAQQLSEASSSVATSGHGSSDRQDSALKHFSQSSMDSDRVREQTPTLPNGSLLGLQRSMQLTRGNTVSLKEDAASFIVDV